MSKDSGKDSGKEYFPVEDRESKNDRPAPAAPQEERSETCRERADRRRDEDGPSLTGGASR